MAYALHVCNQKICPSVVFDWHNLFESGPKCLSQVRPMPCLQNPSTNYFNVYNDDICWQTGSCKLKIGDHGPNFESSENTWYVDLSFSKEKINIMHQVLLNSV